MEARQNMESYLEMNEILACPFCDYSGRDCVYTVHKGVSICVHCDNCGARGILMLTHVDAIKHWNRIAALRLKERGCIPQQAK